MHFSEKDGTRCGAMSMHNEYMCYAHRSDEILTVVQNDMFLIENVDTHAAIQKAFGDVAARLACNHIDLKRAELLITLLRAAFRNLREARREAAAALREAAAAAALEPAIPPAKPEAAPGASHPDSDAPAPHPNSAAAVPHPDASESAAAAPHLDSAADTSRLVELPKLELACAANPSRAPENPDAEVAIDDVGSWGGDADSDVRRAASAGHLRQLAGDAANGPGQWPAQPAEDLED
jgi:hypothetical protein